MATTPAVAKITTEQRVPNGSDGSLLGAFLGWMFVPKAVTDSWEQNDADIRQRALQDQSSTEIQARMASSDAMAKSGQNIREYVSAPFIGNTYEREVADSAVKIATDAVTDAPDVFRAGANGFFNYIMRMIPWWVWAILAVFVVLQLVPLFRSVRSTS